MSEPSTPPRPTRILVVDLLGGLGDLVMALPVIHALHRRHPDAQLRVLTHQPGDVLLQHDPAVAAVVHAERGRERAAVLAELDRWRPDLVVTTTRYDGIADAIEELAPQSVTNLWRSPPADEPVSARYLWILASEHVIDAHDVGLVFVDSKEKAYLSITAHAEVLHDSALARAIWKSTSRSILPRS